MYWVDQDDPVVSLFNESQLSYRHSSEFAGLNPRLSARTFTKAQPGDIPEGQLHRATLREIRNNGYCLNFWLVLQNIA